MLSGILAKAPVVVVTLEDDKDILILRPVNAADPHAPAEDAIIRGAVEVTLSQPRAIGTLRVVMEGLCDCFGGVGFPYKSYTTFHKELVQDLGGEVFPRGTHRFEYSYIVDAKTASHQRANFGRVRHWIKAKVAFTDGKIQNQAKSTPVGIMIHHDPNPPNESAAAHVHMQYDSEDLGPVGVLFSSSHLTVASLLSMRLDILAPNVNSTIISVTPVLTQNFKVIFEEPDLVATPTERLLLPKVKPAVPLSPELSRAGSSSEPSTPPLVSRPQPSLYESRRSKSRGKGKEIDGIFDNRRYRFPNVDGDNLVFDNEPLKQLPRQEEWSYSRILRIPDSNYCRPSTLEGVEGRIRVSHILSCEVRYRVEGDTADKMLIVKKPVTITSCCCLMESLPGYSLNNPNELESGAQPAVKCLCYIPLRQMLDAEGEVLTRAGEVSVDTTATDEELSEARRVKTPSFTQSDSWRGRRRSGGAGDLAGGPNSSSFA